MQKLIFTLLFLASSNIAYLIPPQSTPINTENAITFVEGNNAFTEDSIVTYPGIYKMENFILAEAQNMADYAEYAKYDYRLIESTKAKPLCGLLS